MARRRMIDPNFWVSEDVAKLSVLARLVFIGLFANADDEGRGRAKPAYLRSLLFPYDDRPRLGEVENALAEIGRHLSVRFYTVEGNQYYALEHWHDWQSIDRPKPSRLPAPPEDGARCVGEESTTNRRCVADESRLKEKKPKEPKINPNPKGKEKRVSALGEYRNVVLSAAEQEQLQRELPDWLDWVERLSAYMASTGKTYESHFATIRLWAEREKGGREGTVQGTAAVDSTDSVDPMALRAIQRMMAEDPDWAAP